jgi:hypothetical protein
MQSASRRAFLHEGFDLWGEIDPTETPRQALPQKGANFDSGGNLVRALHFFATPADRPSCQRRVAGGGNPP